MAIDLIVISLAIAIDPISLTAFVIVLASQSGVKKGAAVPSEPEVGFEPTT